MTQFSQDGLLDEQACHRYLLDILRPQRLCCPAATLARLAGVASPPRPGSRVSLPHVRDSVQPVHRHREGAGVHFDPDVVTAFDEAETLFREIAAQYADRT